MRITVCQLPNDGAALEIAWRGLCAHAEQEKSDLVVLPEMPFHRWVAGTRDFDERVWRDAVRSHERWIARFDELGAPWAASSRPVVDSGRRHNRAYLWHANEIRDAYDKTYLPEEPGFWEASWYHPGAGVFAPVAAGDARVGFLLCTDLWFAHRGREYGRKGAQLLLVPRATEVATLSRWRIGGQALAIVSGCFVFSSNLCAPHGDDTSLGGMGFAVDPNGTVLAATNEEAPFATVEIDPAVADAAQLTYPRYVKAP